MKYDEVLHYLIYFLYFLAITIIVYGIVVQYIGFLKSEVKSKDRKKATDNIMLLRNFLGTYILFSLEILIGADIIESILDPSIDHIFSLAALVIIRTIISYFLNKEIESNKNEQKS
ncbi:MAG: DUF1622 domain-containing protein [Peptostreptococcaceae bacterium]